MGILGKKGVSTIDYTLLQKKGLIKKKEEVKKDFSVNPQGFVDFTKQQAVSAPTAKAESSSPFGFLDTMAQSASTQPQETSIFSSLDSPAPSQEGASDISSMRIKVEDLEYKLERLIEKLAMIESKLDGFEKKVFG